MNVGIHSVGIYLPEKIRRNDWWPERIVDTWQEERQARNVARAERSKHDPATEGAQVTFAGMEEYASDPFKGARERRIMPDDMKSSDMEVRAAEEAIQRAGIDRAEIGLVFVFSGLPDQLAISNATLVHHRLGLRRDCLSMGTESGCNAFLHQFSLAQQMIRGGRARYALLIQSAGAQHTCRAEDPHSAWFGDGATAVIVGPVAEGRGLLGEAHYTDGSMHDALQAGCPGKARWHDSGEPIVLYVKDRGQARKMLMIISDIAREAVLASLEQAGAKPEDVRFYATHQSTAWFRKVTQEYIGLKNARSFDSFHWTASMQACNIPFMLGMGEREGTLRENDLVAMYTGGSGIVWSGMTLRWGR